MGLFKRRDKEKIIEAADKTLNYDEAVRAGSSIGKIVTNLWNSQKNPGKAFIFNRRVHHGEIGILLGLSNLFKKSRPGTSGVLSGLGEVLSQDDIADKDEWFKFKKKKDKPKLQVSSSKAEGNDNEEPKNTGNGSANTPQ
ncbi:MAG: hypothetical protein ABJB85_11320 [Nitrososphaerota archaeon]